MHWRSYCSADGLHLGRSDNEAILTLPLTFAYRPPRHGIRTGMKPRRMFEEYKLQKHIANCLS